MGMHIVSPLRATLAAAVLVSFVPLHAWQDTPPAPPTLAPMAADADPSFAAATIRPSIPGDGRAPIIQIQRRRWIAINRTVMDLITESYSLHPSQVVNGPSWLGEQYDITAVPDGEGQPRPAQWRSMVRKLLADRFQLSTHSEQRELSVYALTAKRVLPLAPGTGDPAGPANLAMPAQGRFAGRNASMADFARVLGGVVDRPVVDRTGISGRYDLNLSWTVDEFQSAKLKGFPVPRAGAEVPGLFTALEEQFGLRLETAKVPGDVLVIDHIERPSEN